MRRWIQQLGKGGKNPGAEHIGQEIEGETCEECGKPMIATEGALVCSGCFEDWEHGRLVGSRKVPRKK